MENTPTNALNKKIAKEVIFTTEVWRRAVDLMTEAQLDEILVKNEILVAQYFDKSEVKSF